MSLTSDIRRQKSQLISCGKLMGGITFYPMKFTFKKEITIGEIIMAFSLAIAGFGAYFDLKAGQHANEAAISRGEERCAKLETLQSEDRKMCADVFQKINDNQTQLALSLTKVQVILDERSKRVPN